MMEKSQTQESNHTIDQLLAGDRSIEGYIRAIDTAEGNKKLQYSLTQQLVQKHPYPKVLLEYIAHNIIEPMIIWIKLDYLTFLNKFKKSSARYDT